MQNKKIMLKVNHVSKRIRLSSKKEREILTDISFEVNKGEFVSIMGPSGSGKSTLLGLLAGIDTVSAGKILIDDTDLTKLTGNQLVRFRNEHIGLVLQSPNLIDTLNIIENVTVPISFNKDRPENHAKDLLELVGLQQASHAKPTNLSGGEQQRVSIARALACDPGIILADEPTGALDSENGRRIITILKDLSVKKQVTVIMVTHDAGMAEYSDRIIRILDGKVVA